MKFLKTMGRSASLWLLGIWSLLNVATAQEMKTSEFAGTHFLYAATADAPPTVDNFGAITLAVLQSPTIQRAALIGIVAIAAAHVLLLLTLLLDVTVRLKWIPLFSQFVQCYGIMFVIFRPINREHWKFSIIVALQHGIAAVAAVAGICLIGELYPQTPAWAMVIVAIIAAAVFHRLLRPVTIKAICYGLFGRVTVYEGGRNVCLYPRN
jgi:vacuolar-type H+-ATPase subunit I/STV1